MRFTPDATGEVVTVDGTAGEFRAVLPRLGPAVRAVIADQVARVGDSQTVSLLVYADAATEIAEIVAAVAAERPVAEG